ncbi:heavy-metal-associated domain-containing protein [Avibacterium sp. 20-15]|uniref:heavy-metal-associated domain-containing protein n=1 Tax=unclassified Avibacterium TaxID=2685287 RepID=UPI00202729D3|nr:MULTISPECIES: heavy-metal-associated domain-containing protein [unclassified Avibacterium]MCW9733059.1 heavy-metal-associated domain-containing protein [Avibacterium sp. 20-15]URL05187.1 heavy-metal-associated domain-containing protein [Avibacterium sp. 20-132]URL06743.1 heavy-metal-associated domain-containing protein [Avibacterium sp. 21-595]
MKKILLFLTALSFSLSSLGAERKVTLHIEEMNCQLCVYLVNKVLRNIDGVQSTKANFNSRSVNVVAEENVSDEMLIQAIDSLHYHAVVQK